MTEQNAVNPLVRFNNVRLAFPHIYEKSTPKGSPNATPAYSSDFIVDPSANAAEWKAFENTVRLMAEEKWKAIAPQVLEVIQGDRKMRCFGSGNEKRDKKTMQPYAEFDGMLFIGGRGVENAPDLYSQTGELIDVNNALDDAPKFYGGCYVNVAIKLWLQDNAHGRAVRSELVAIQFLKDGEPFAAHKVDTRGMFGAVDGAPAATAGSFEPEDDAPPSFF